MKKSGLILLSLMLAILPALWAGCKNGSGGSASGGSGTGDKNDEINGKGTVMRETEHPFFYAENQGNFFNLILTKF